MYFVLKCAMSMGVGTVYPLRKCSSCIVGIKQPLPVLCVNLAQAPASEAMLPVAAAELAAAGIACSVAEDPSAANTAASRIKV